MEILFVRVCNYKLKNILGETLKEHIEKLIKQHEDNFIHCCGEGGEFETFVLDCSIYRKRIIVEE
jgi:diphthine-ammonia ligase